jgi:hypothetical protein
VGAGLESNTRPRRSGALTSEPGDRINLIPEWLKVG